MIRHSPLDGLIAKADTVLRTLSGAAAGSGREYPAAGIREGRLSDEEKTYSARLMRVNHAGEIAAQGLYHGQAFVARDEKTRDYMLQNAHEESDHLRWCLARIDQLGGHVSLLSPFWYINSVLIGIVAGAFGNRWNHAFVRETEEQVVEHLQSHIDRISQNDVATIAIIKQIQVDEAGHAESARRNSAQELPPPLKLLMRSAAKIMTHTAHRI